MYNKSPRKCPGCGAKDTMVKVRQQRTKFSPSKALAGSLIAGPLGTLVGGLLGNKRITYRCTECGFIQEPDKLV